MDVDGSCLTCSCVVESLDASGVSLRKQVLKKVALELGRNEVGDVVLRLTYPEGKQGDRCIQLQM